jgi:hypothetical protein
MIGYIIVALIVAFFGYKGLKTTVLEPRRFMREEADGNYNAVRRTYANAAKR